MQLTYILTSFDRSHIPPAADDFEEFGNFACGLLQMAFGKEVRVKLKGKGPDDILEPSLINRIMAFAFGIFILPISLPLTIAGVISLSCSESYNNLFKECLNKAKIDPSQEKPKAAEKPIIKIERNPPPAIVKRVQRKGFVNNSMCCPIASTMQSLVTIRSSLPNASSLSPENQEIGKIILDTLDKIIGGTEGTDADLNKIKKLLGLGDELASAEVFQKIFSIFDLDLLKFFIPEKNQWVTSINPVSFNEYEEDNPLFIKNENQNDCFRIKIPILNKSDKILDNFMLMRRNLPHEKSHRKSLDIPKIIQIPRADQEGKFDEFELTATVQSEDHAVAFCKEDNEWVQYDDHVVSKMTDADANAKISKNSRILVYRRVNNSPQN